MAQRCHDLPDPHGLTIADATQAMIKTLRVNTAARAIDTAAAEFYQSKVMQGVCRMRLNLLRGQTRELAALFPGRLVSDLTANDVRT